LKLCVYVSVCACTHMLMLGNESEYKVGYVTKRYNFWLNIFIVRNLCEVI